MNTKKPGLEVTLDKDGARIIKAIAQNSWSDLTTEEFNRFRQSLHDWSEGEAVLPCSPYHNALGMIRGRETSAVAIANALGGDGRFGNAGDIWALYDVAQETRRAERLLRTSGGTASLAAMRGVKIVVGELDADAWTGDTEDRSQTDEEAAAEYRSAQAEMAAITTEGPVLDIDDEDLPTRPRWETSEPITATFGALCFIAQVGGHEIKKWFKQGCPLYGFGKRDGREMVFDLIALSDWLWEIERDALRYGTKTVGRLNVTTLMGARSRINRKIVRTIQQQAELKVECARKRATEAAAILDDVAGLIGWGEIEEATGLRHVPAAGRAA